MGGQGPCQGRDTPDLEPRNDGYEGQGCRQRPSNTQSSSPRIMQMTDSRRGGFLQRYQKLGILYGNGLGYRTTVLQPDRFSFVRALGLPNLAVRPDHWMAIQRLNTKERPSELDSNRVPRCRLAVQVEPLPQPLHGDQPRSNPVSRKPSSPSPIGGAASYA